MKRLIIALVATMAVFATNAASMKWSITKTVMDAGATTSSSPAYFFLNSGLTSQAAIMSAYALGTDITTLAADTFTLSGGKGYHEYTESAPTGAVNAYYVVITEGRMFMSTAADSTWDGVGQAGQWTSPADTVASMSIIGEAKAGFSGAGWYTASAIPEPTSGLMLLLGVGLMALRRRRA